MKYSNGVQFLKKNDEMIMNLMLLSVSTFTLKSMDENITCKRSSNFPNLYIIDDFWSATYGFDSECLQWKATVQSISLLSTIVSLIFLTNQCFDNFYLYTKNYEIAQSMTRNFIISSILMNFVTKFYSSFLNTGFGHWFHGVILMYYYHRFTFLNGFIEKYSFYFKNSQYYS